MIHDLKFTDFKVGDRESTLKDVTSESLKPCRAVACRPGCGASGIKKRLGDEITGYA